MGLKNDTTRYLIENIGSVWINVSPTNIFSTMLLPESQRGIL